MTAIRKNLADFVAIVGVVVLGLGIGVYILANQRLRFPLVEEPFYTVKAELPDAQAVTPGQGQTVVIAGVRVGDIGSVDLEDGRAVVELQLEPRYKGMITDQATALLRAKTGTKDMFLEVDPGDGKPLPKDGRIPVSNTLPDIDPDEFLAALDGDTRNYLKLLISGAGKGLEGRGTDLRATLERLGPLHRDLARVSRAVAERRQNMRRLVNRYGLLMAELGKSDKDITRLVRSSNSTLGAFADEDQNISSLVSKLPGTLNQTASTLGKVDTLADQMGPTFQSLRAPFSKLDETNAAVLPFVKEAAPILQKQVRPFARAAQPFQRDFGAASKDLARANPDMTAAFHGLNRLFDIGAYNPGGTQGISEACEKAGACTPEERARNESYLYWLAWVGQNTTSLFSTADALGPIRRAYLLNLNCAVFTSGAKQAGMGDAEANGLGDLFSSLGGVLGAMIKQNPSIGRMIAMAGFTLSVFAILIFLWLAFGGTVPLKPEGYRFTVHMPEAATLAEEADVRMAGVNVGKVKSKELDEGGARTIVEVQLDDAYAPIPKDTHAILRQKTLLGETYLELTPGNRSAGMLKDGSRLANAQVENTTELDEIFTAFDPQTRQAFRDWVKELDGAITKGHRSEDLNDAFGNFEGFAVDGAKLMQVLDEQDQAVHNLVRNTGQVFGAINERRGALRELILNSKRTFEATAARDKALAQTFAIFPTFLDESKATMARLEDFSHNADPLVNDLKGPADDLGPTVRDLGDLAPDLEKLFRNLGPLIRVSRTGVPALGRTLDEAKPLADALHTFLPELNPILSFFNFHQTTIAAFITNGGADLAADYGTGQRGQTQIGIIEGRSFEPYKYGSDPPPWVRGNAYMHPNSLMRALKLGTIESFKCPKGELRQPDDAVKPGESHEDKLAPCFELPPSLYDGKVFSLLRRGVAPLRSNPKGFEGTKQAKDPVPGD